MPICFAGLLPLLAFPLQLLDTLGQALTLQLPGQLLQLHQGDPQQVQEVSLEANDGSILRVEQLKYILLVGARVT